MEATANWYWITDEIEQAGCRPRLVHPRNAKLMMGQINKTDKSDTHGLNILQRNATLPTVWIPPGPLRELRELVVAMFLGAAFGAIIIRYSIAAALALATAISVVCSAALFRALRTPDKP